MRISENHTKSSSATSWAFVLLQVNQLGVYGGFIGNYEDAIEVVRRCSHLDARFRMLAEVTQTLQTLHLSRLLKNDVPLTVASFYLFCAEHDA